MLAANICSHYSSNQISPGLKNTDLEASCQDPNPPELQDKNQNNTQLSRRTSRNSWRHRAQPCSPGRAGFHGEDNTTHSENCHYTCRPQRRRTQCAVSGRPTHHVCWCSKSARSAHEFCARTRSSHLRQAGHDLLVHLIQRDVTSPLFFLPLILGGLGVGSAVQRHAAAPWRAWQSVILTLMATTQSPDTVTRHRHPFQCGTTTRNPTSTTPNHTFTTNEQARFPFQPLGAALHLKTTQKKQVSTIQRNLHKQLHDSLTDTPVERSVLLSQSTSHTGAHLMQPSSEAYEAGDRCFRVSVARRLMLYSLAQTKA